MKTPSIIQIIIMSSLFFVMGCEQDNEIVKSLSKETLSHEFIQIKEEAQLSEWLEEMALTASNARVTAVLDDISFEESIKRTDSLGNVMYALHMKSANQLSLKNLWLYEIGGKIEGRIIQYDLDRSWLRLNGFNGWDSYTGYFSVYTLDNELLYETKIVEGSSVSPASNVRSHGLVCTTITDKICVSVPHMPELGEDCYYDTKTSCTWYTPRPETSGVFTGAVIDPIPIADYERAASCAYNERYNDYTKQCEPRCGANEVYSTIHGCVDRCDRGEIRNENGECVSEAEAIVAELKELLDEDPFALIQIDCDQIENWQEIVQHTPPQSVLDKIQNLDENSFGDFDVQNIKDASGAVVNMDYFPVKINELPNNPATNDQFSPNEFLEHIRKNINSFIDTNLSEFSPSEVTGIDEEVIWNSDNPIGSILHIDISGGPGDGSVICSQHSPTKWTFTTIEVPYNLFVQGYDGEHPVSGNREFGIEQNNDGSYTFYTRGVDRITTPFDSGIAQIFYGDNAFDDPDALWNSFKTGVHEFVEINGGYSQQPTDFDNSISRPNWDDVRNVLEGNKPISDLGCD